MIEEKFEVLRQAPYFEKTVEAINAIAIELAMNKGQLDVKAFASVKKNLMERMCGFLGTKHLKKDINIMNMFETREVITTQQVLKEFNLSHSQAFRELKKLIDEDLIEMVGRRRGAAYKVKK